MKINVVIINYILVKQKKKNKLIWTLFQSNFIIEIYKNFICKFADLFIIEELNAEYQFVDSWYWKYDAIYKVIKWTGIWLAFPLELTHLFERQTKHLTVIANIFWSILHTNIEI